MKNVLERKGILTLKKVLDELEVISATKGRRRLIEDDGKNLWSTDLLYSEFNLIPYSRGGLTPSMMTRFLPSFLNLFLIFSS